LSESNDPIGLSELVQGHLASKWLYVTVANDPSTGTDAAIRDAIRRSINSKTKTYRYVLPTQLLSKLARPELDCRSVQAGSGLAGSFDARSICHGVVVPFDRENNNVLGGSSEPYLNNPLRIPAIRPAARKAQKDKDGFDDLMKVLDYAQDHPEHLVGLVREVLTAIKDRLAEVSVAYPVPNRASLQQTHATLRDFLSDRTGGLQLQAVAVAIFRVIGSRFNLFTEVQSSNVNSADASTRSAADLECIDDAGEIVMAVEVKDRQLELRQVQDKLPAVREKGIRELLFLVQGGTSIDGSQSVSDTIAREFVTGQNVYVLEWDDFIGSCLVLFGEAGRREFLQQVGKELDKQKADISHRRKWATLLGTI
jgi:hypothetical protein